MFTKNITISVTFVALFAVLAIALPITFSDSAELNKATVEAWGGGGSDGGGGGGDYGGGGCGGCGSDPTPTPTPTPTPEPRPAVCNFLKANGQTGTLTLPYGHSGDVNLTWSSTRATGATLTPDGSSVSVIGGKSVQVAADTVFTFRVSNRDGADSCRVAVEVQKERALTCQDVVFEANPNSPVFAGTSVNLSWVFTGDVSAATIDNGIGDAFARNNADVTINETTTFNATISNATSQKSCPFTINVKENKAPSCDSFEATPRTLPYGGGQALLTWGTTNADSVTIDNGVGAVLANNTAGYPVNVTETITYTMTVSAAGYEDVTCPAKITVGTPKTISCEANATFTASDYSLPRGGGNVTLAWTTTDIDSIAINGVSSTNLNDSESVNVTSDRTYTLEITADGVTEYCPLKIDVATGGGGGGSSSPRCDLDISDEKIKLGESITLEWDTSRTSEVRIEDNHGNVLLDSDDSDDLEGELTIKPTKDTEYTLSATRGTKGRDCEVEVEVENNVTVFESRTQNPMVAGISLTQVPYTGFEAGPALTMIFYTLLTLWGLFVAYVVVIKKSSLGGVSLAGAHDHVDFTDQSVEASNTQESSVAEGYVYEATTADVPANLPTAQPLDTVVGYEAYVEKKTMME